MLKLLELALEDAVAFCYLSFASDAVDNNDALGKDSISKRVVKLFYVAADDDDNDDGDDGDGGIDQSCKMSIFLHRLFLSN